jgi:hypothetical protein
LRFSGAINVYDKGGRYLMDKGLCEFERMEIDLTLKDLFALHSDGNLDIIKFLKCVDRLLHFGILNLRIKVRNILNDNYTHFM